MIPEIWTSGLVVATFSGHNYGVIPVIIAMRWVLRYRATIVGQELVTEPVTPCPCGQALASLEVQRELRLFGGPCLQRRIISAFQCPHCGKRFVRPSAFVRWLSVVPFFVMTLLVWMVFLGFPTVMLRETLGNLRSFDLEIVGFWSLVALVAGSILFLTGRSLWKRIRNALGFQLTEVDKTFSISA